MATLVIAIFSLYVAVAAYQKSVTDSEEQQKNLDASRSQLQAVVDAATKQQEILSQNLETSKAQQDLLSKSLETSKIQQEIQRKNLDTSKAQLGVLEEQQKREAERQARKPIAEISLQTNAGMKLLDDLEKVPEIEFRLEESKKWSRLVFLVLNKGKAEISRPVVRIVASPETVFIDRAELRLAERVEHNTIQFSGPTFNDIEPAEVTGGPYKYMVDITVPDSINAFDLNFSITGKNLTRKEHTLHLKIIRSPS
jgi:multidrug efflux pump subunit AcrA (membrane-fusion protein)